MKGRSPGDRTTSLLGRFRRSRLPVETIPEDCRLIFVHVGKCGGSTVEAAIGRSSFKNQTHSVHLRPAPHLPRMKYLLVVRNPVERVLSAFNWRYRLVVEESLQETRFPGERKVLEKYRSLNALAEGLYVDGLLNPVVASDFQKIHHVAEGFDYHLREVLDCCRPDQIIGVLMQETLDEDLLRVLGVSSELREKDNSSSSRDRSLNERALSNLRRFLCKDYTVLLQLYLLGLISKERFDRLL